MQHGDAADRAAVCQKLLNCEIRDHWIIASKHLPGCPFHSPPYFRIVPHLNLFFHFLTLKLSLLMNRFLFPFFIFIFCLALHEQIIKASLLQGALGRKKKSARSYLKWAVKFANCCRKSRYSFLLQENQA